MEQKKRTEIATLGQFGLIDRLTQGFEHSNASTLVGVGDDAAAVAPKRGEAVLCTTDTFYEGVDFDLTYFPLKHLGYKVVTAGVSDILAMNGIPTQLTVSLGVSSKLSVEALDDLYEGIRFACREQRIDLVGGDTRASMTGLVISVTVLGQVDKKRIVRRSGARQHDLICITGNLGAAYLGLQLLEREKVASAGQKDFQPQFQGKEYLIERQLKPEARRDIIESLEKAGIVPTSMMDISDGLSSELLHICKASNVGCRVYEDRIPIDYQTALMAEELNMNLVTAAMNGGEDYELLFTVPLHMHDEISKIPGVKVIGNITKPELGCVMVTRDDTEIAIRAQGWNPLAKEN